LINEEGEASPGLNNDYTYQRFNPSVGIAYQTAARSTWYASAGTSNRVPTPVELACSDPEFPCLLPNAMAADPFLEQVITTTVEGGYRTRWAGGNNQYGFSFNIFQANNKNDILFVTDGAGSGGFFRTTEKPADRVLNWILTGKHTCGISVPATSTWMRRFKVQPDWPAKGTAVRWI